MVGPTVGRPGYGDIARKENKIEKWELRGWAEILRFHVLRFASANLFRRWV